MTTIISQATDFVDDVAGLIKDKENPDEWYVLVGSHVTEYNVNVADKPPELDDAQDVPEDMRPATENVDGFWQIGTLGWAGEVIDEDRGFVMEAGEAGGDVDTRLLGTLLVHESMLSEEAIEEMNGGAEQEASADD